MDTVNQQINLYHPIFWKKKVVFSAAAVLQILLVVGLGMSVIYAYSLWQNLRLGQELRELETREQAAQVELERVESQLPERMPNRLLEQQVERLQTTKRLKSTVLDILRTQQVNSGDGFSGHFEGLGRHTVSGLWLSSIQLDEGGEYLEISGGATRPELVPEFLQLLAAEEVYVGTQFEVLSFNRPSDDSSVIDFRLLTKNADED